MGRGRLVGGNLRALITGVAGFAGSHLADFLLANTSWRVSGSDRPGSNRYNLQQLEGRLDYLEGDLTDPDQAMAVYDRVRPDYVFHLAGQASVADSWSRPWETFVVNVRSQLNLLLAAVKLGPPRGILAVGSADEYGSANATDSPLSEDRLLLPSNPYGVSKVAQDLLGYQYYRGYGLPVVRVRPFNHIGPRQSDSFVASSFARQIAEAELGRREPVIRVGNLEVRRDFCDVRDIVRGYYLALTLGVPGEAYNIGLGTALRIADLLDILLSMATCQVRVEPDPEKTRPSDVREIRCDCSKFHAQTGWAPTIGIERTLADLLDYWRIRLRAET